MNPALFGAGLGLLVLGAVLIDSGRRTHRFAVLTVGFGLYSVGLVLLGAGVVGAAP